MSGEPILEVRDATKTFGGILALNRISLQVDQGEILGIIGPNGSGKTTYQLYYGIYKNELREGPFPGKRNHRQTGS